MGFVGWNSLLIHSPYNFMTYVVLAGWIYCLVKLIQNKPDERHGRILLWISFVLGSLLLFCDVWVGYGTVKFIAI